MKFDYNKFKVPEAVSISLKKYATREDGGLNKKAAKVEPKEKRFKAPSPCCSQLIISRFSRQKYVISLIGANGGG